ncbi:putative quinol monooxygenase [Hoeflea sp. TYP-13]|uniref:putative quinol monooxygenase n=1 Tax=Hoeflea sp. TYP-13 TaxID=3230023 RepID=UPI0034C60CF2
MPHLRLSRRALIFSLAACFTPVGGARAADEASVKKGDKTMSGSDVSWVFSVTIKDGAVEKLKAIIAEMADGAKASEPGTLGYEWSISDDGKNGQVHEHYRDSEAALTHLASFNENFAARLMELVEPTGMVVFGEPSAALKKELEGADPVYMQPAGGFVR